MCWKKHLEFSSRTPEVYWPGNSMSTQIGHTAVSLKGDVKSLVWETTAGR